MYRDIIVKGRVIGTELVGDATAPSKTFRQTELRQAISRESQIKFDRVYSKIESSSIIPSANTQTRNMATGITKRDVLRTALFNWRHRDSVDAASDEFLDEAAAIHAAGIITDEELAAITG